MNKKDQTYKCPFCGVGKMTTQIMDYELVDSLGKKITITDAEIDICNHCKEKIFSYKTAVKLEAIKNKGNRITLYLKPDLQTQILNLAEKNQRSFDEEINALLEASLS